MRRNLDKIPRKKPKQDRARVTVEAIVEATTRILEEDGLAGLSTNRVARVAGVSVGSLYQYFPNKEALVAEVRARFAARFEERILRTASRVPTLSLREAIHEWVHTLVELHAESPGVHHELGRGTPRHAHAPMLAFLTRYLESRGDEVRRPDRELAARLLLEAGEALVHNTALREPERLHDAAWVAEVCELLCRYAAADPADATPDAGLG